MTTTLALLHLEPGDVWRFEFGDSLEPEGDTAQLLERILEEYEHRSDEIYWLGNDARLLLLATVRARRTSPLLPRALDALGRFARPDGWEDVAALTMSVDPPVRPAAIRALGQMGKPASADALARFLSHPDLELRRAALISIGKLARRDLVPLMQVAAGGDPAMQQLLAEATQRIDATERRDVQAVFDVVVDTDEYRDLVPLGQMLTNRILHEFIENDPPPTRQAHLADLCGLMSLCRASQRFIDILNDESTSLDARTASTAGLGRCRVEFALPLIVSLLDRPEVELRAEAITALGFIGSPRVFHALLRRWDDAGGRFRPRLRLALRRIAIHPDVASMIALLSAPSSRVVADFVVIDEHLERKDEHAAALIVSSLRSTQASERLEASFALAFTGRVEDVGQLKTLSQHDPDDAVRVVAGHAADVLASRRRRQP